MTQTTPKSMRLHIGLFGRTNVGKSSFLNAMAGQDVAITSATPGTTTDVVEKSMELLPIGPVVFLDTAGVDDVSELAGERLKRTKKAFERMEIMVILVTPNEWTDFEDTLVNEAHGRDIPVLVVINKADTAEPSMEFLSLLEVKHLPWIQGNAIGDAGEQEIYRNAFKEQIQNLLPQHFTAPPALVGDLLPSGGLAVLVVPIDLGAPKGRLILPQVQSIRDLLDNDASVLVVKDRELAATLGKLNTPPDLVVCDSQVVARAAADTPEEVKFTTFSVLYARFKGDLMDLAKGAAAIDGLKSGDKVLIAEGCSHHPMEDDIGRVKIPRWLKQYTGADIQIDVYAGRDFPDNLDEYKVIIHCGGCILSRKEILNRMSAAARENVAMTNYGLAISMLQGVLKRALSPFPDVLAAIS